jgi:hypothetical protein
MRPVQRVYFVISILIFLGSTATKAGGMALPIAVEWDDSVLHQGKETVKTITDIVNAAFGVVESFPPEGDNIFCWKGSRETLEGKRVVLYLTESTSPLVAKVFASRGDPAINVNTFDGDSLTAVMALKKGDVTITVMLLLDRLFFSQGTTGNYERPDALVRIMIALAHEIYGNVQADLQSKFVKGLPTEPFNLNRRELASFRASLDFIDRIEKSDAFIKFPFKVQSDFVEAKKREEEALAHFQGLVCTEGLSGHSNHH